MCPVSYYVYLLYRVTKQAVNADVNTLGGVSLKTPIPSEENVLKDFCRDNELEFPCGPIPTVYRIEFKGVIYYSRTYKRVKKRNSYTIIYHGDVEERFGSIEYFLVLNHKVIAVMKSLDPISATCQDHFLLNTTVLDNVLVLTPVVKTSSIVCCFVESFVQKCLFMDFNCVQYISKFPSTITFD